MFVRQSLGMPARPWMLAWFAWAAVTGIGIAIWTSIEIERQRQLFEQDSAQLFAVVQQKLDQNEAVLTGLEALLGTVDDAQFDRVRGYARQMLGRYPHIYTVGLQPRIALGEVRAFEERAGRLVRPGYEIRDSRLDPAGKRVFYRAAERPFYYPVVFMEPPVDSASPILGMDLYVRPNTKVAIDASVRSGRAAVSAPVTLYEGGRGYILLKVLFNTATPAADYAERHLQATRTVSLMIRTAQFLGRDDAKAAAMEMRLYHQAYARNDPKGQLYELPATVVPAPETALPVFSFVRSFSNAAQPFVFETRRALGWDIVSIPVAILSALISFSLVLLAVVISHLRRSDALLFHERERALVTLDSISDAVITLDAAGLVEFANPAAESMLGRGMANFRGEPANTVLVLEYMLARTSTVDPFDACIRTRRVVDLPDNSVLVGKGGARLLVEGSCSPISDRSGALVGVVVVWRDMGPVRKQALAMLEAGEKRLREHQAELAHVARLNTIGEMASGIAHEINQPLAAILSYNQACVRMLEDEESDADLGEVIAAMKAAGAQSKRAGEIIARLRAFVSKQAPRSVPVNVNQVIQNALLLTEHYLREEQVKVVSRLAADLPDVVADSIQLEQVVLNLVRNGVDAMKLAGRRELRITITSVAVDGGVTVAVQDCGAGIASEAQAHLFHPFFTTKADGMGLGLTISHTIIETYGGRLQGSNASEGGAIFSFWLPLSQELAVHIQE